MSTVHHDEERRRFTLEVDGHEAELDYRLAGGTMAITHTGVPQPVAGRGVAAQLMRAALETAQQRGWSVDPVCSYARAYMQRHGAAKPAEG